MFSYPSPQFKYIACQVHLHGFNRIKVAECFDSQPLDNFIHCMLLHSTQSSFINWINTDWINVIAHKNNKRPFGGKKWAGNGIMYLMGGLDRYIDWYTGRDIGRYSTEYHLILDRVLVKYRPILNDWQCTNPSPNIPHQFLGCTVTQLKNNSRTIQCIKSRNY